MSKESRQLVMKRHVSYILFYLIANIYFVINAVVFASDGGNDNLDFGWVYSFKILFFSQGLIMPCLRLLEPFFFKIVREKMAKAWNSMVLPCQRGMREERNMNFE